MLTDNLLAPQVTHRADVRLLIGSRIEQDLANVRHIVINARHPWPDTEDVAADLVERLPEDPRFVPRFELEAVYLFSRAEDP